MVRLAIAAALLLLQDPSDNVRALVNKLSGEDIAERDAASKELIKIGPSALPALRRHHAASDGELKAQLGSIIRRLERLIRKDEIIKGPRITLPGGGRRVAEVMADVARQGRLQIDCEGLPADERVDVELKGVPLWEAIDRVCRAHGKIMYTYAARRILIEPLKHREVPNLHLDGIFFFLDHLLLDRDLTAPQPRVLLKPAVAWPPGSSPVAYRLETEKFEDDLGTDLQGGQKWAPWIWFKGAIGETISSPLYYHSFAGGVPDKASKIAVWKGTLRLRFPVELKPAVSIPDPFKTATPFDEDGAYSVSISSPKRVGADASLTALVSTPLKDDPDVDYHNLGLANLLVLRDSKGGMIRGDGETHPGSGAPRKDNGRATRLLDFTFKIPEGAEIVSLDLLKLEDLEDVEIPFEFKDIRFRGAGR